MILQCEKCTTRYVVPNAAIPPEGRMVRCASCGHMWNCLPEAEPAMDLSAFEFVEKESEPLPEGSNLPALRARPVPASLKAACIALLMLNIGAALLYFKPGLLGLPPSDPLVIGDVKFRKIQANKKDYYQIDARIENRGEVAMAIPSLKIISRNKKGETLQFWDFSGGGMVLEPGKSTPFSSGELENKFTTAVDFKMELGNPLELALRH